MNNHTHKHKNTPCRFSWHVGTHRHKRKPPTNTHTQYAAYLKVPLLKEAHVQGRLKFATEHLNDSKEDWETGCGQMRPKSRSLASTRLAAFGGGRMLNMTPSPPS